MKKQDKPSSSSSNFTMGKAFFYLGGGILAFFGLGKMIAANAANSTSGSIQDDNNARIATRIYNILSQSNALDWYKPTNYSILLQVLPIAKEITDWQAVQTAYRNLYGEDITTLLNENLLPTDYQTFLNYLQVRGSQTNTTNSAKIEPVRINATPNVSRIILTAAKNAVNSYKSTSDYPSKPYISWPQNTAFNQTGVLYLATSKVSYLGSSVTMNLHQVQLSNGTKVWIRDADVGRWIY